MPTRSWLDREATTELTNCLDYTLYKYGATKSFIPIEHSNHNINVKQLIEQGANPNAKGERGITALMVAAKFNHLEMAHWLLQAGANPNFFNGHFETPLKIAAWHNHPEMAQLLLTAGANPPF